MWHGQCRSAPTRWDKNCHTQFKLNEAERLSAVLGLSMYERDLCFFEEQNRREALARRADEKRRGECDKRAEK